MLRPKSSVVIFFLVVLFFVSGCNDDNPSSPDFSGEKLLSKLTTEPGSYVLYLYEGDRLSKCEIYSHFEYAGSIELEYNEEGLLKSEHSVSAGGSLFMARNCSYNSEGQLDSVANVIYSENSEPKIYEYFKYHYDTQNRLIESIDYDTDDEMTFKTEYIYENNNILQKVTYDPNGFFEKETMTYDDQVNPFFSLKGSLIENTPSSENNVLSTIRNSVVGEGTQTFVSAYTYDSDGYPLKKITEYEGEQDSVTYEY